jgi:hypothetical protein
LKRRFDLDQNASGHDLRLVSLAAEPIYARFDSDFLTVDIIGAGRQTQATSHFVNVVQEFVDQGAKPSTLFTLLRCLLVDHRAPPTTTSRQH